MKKAPKSIVDMLKNHNKIMGKALGYLKPCPECKGSGEVDVLDEDNIREFTVTPPYKKIPCGACEGSGERALM